MFNRLLEIILATDEALMHLVQDYGVLTYIILFLIVYSETGLLFFPFLPGDGLLFSIGVITGLGHLSLIWLIFLLITAAFAGNLTSYFLGRYSLRFFDRIRSQRWHSYMANANQFYFDYGGNAVLWARFFPILRTYVPFVAGVTKMDMDIFTRNSLLGAILWVLFFLIGGFHLGAIPWVEHNYGLIFLGLIIITILPIPIRYLIRKIRK